MPPKVEIRFADLDRPFWSAVLLCSKWTVALLVAQAVIAIPIAIVIALAIGQLPELR